MIKDKFTNIMLDIIPSWKTLDEIISDLACKYDYFTQDDGRGLRKMFENYNKEYQAHLTNGYYIAHSNKGYKITLDREDMKKSLKEKHKKAITMLADESRTLKAMGEDLNSQELLNEIDEQTKKTS